MNFAWLYIAALYGAAVALARRAGVDIPRRVALLFYLLTLLFLFKPLAGPYVNVAPDVLKLIPPWSADAPPGFDKFDVSNYELQDIVLQFIPWTKQVHESWRAGQVPLWNPLAGCGVPLLANMQSGALSPLRLLTIGLRMPYAFSAEAALKILVALTFAFLYCRRRYDVMPSVIGAIAFGFGTFITLWLHFPHPNVAAFLPAVLYQIDLLGEKYTFGRFVFAAALGPVVLAGGHPETAAHIAFFALLYVLWLILVEKKRQLFGTLVAASVVGILLAAPILLPFLEILPMSMGYEAAHASGHDEGTAFSDFPSLALLVNPRLYGQRPGPLWGGAVTETVTGFAGLIGIGAWFGLLARAIAERRFRERETFYLIIAALVFLWLDDIPIVSAPLRMLFSIALNARLRLEFSFFLAVLIAALIHYARRRDLVVAVAGALGALAYVLAKTQFPGADAKRFALATAVPSIVVLALAAALAIRRTRPLVLPLLALALYVELWGASHSWHSIHPAADLYRRTPLVETLLDHRTSEPYRILGIGAPLFPNTQAPFRLEDVRVKDALASERYLDLLRGTKGWLGGYYERWMDPDSRLLDDLNVRWVVTERGMELADRNRYSLLYDGPDGRVYENLDAKPRFYATDAHVIITKWRGDAYELDVDAARPARVFSSVALYPGWRVTHKGRTLAPQLVNGAFLGFDVPAGRGVVRVRYVPLSFWGGLAIALLTAIALFALRRSGIIRAL